jgi:hypothetical protein
LALGTGEVISGNENSMDGFPKAFLTLLLGGMKDRDCDENKRIQNYQLFKENLK